MTVRDLIYSSLRLIGAIGNGEVPSNSDAQDALLALNLLIDSYSTENLMIPAIVRELFTCVGGQQTYSVGPTGDFVTSRPNRIQDAGIIVLGSNPIVELPLKPINVDLFSSIFVKSVQSQIPLWIYNDNAFPNTNISLWPVPQGNNQIALYSQKGLSIFSGLDDIVALAPGGNRMLKFGLAVEIAPEYGKDELDPKIIAVAEGAKANYKRAINQNKVYYSSVDDALTGHRDTFNWLTGDTV